MATLNLNIDARGAQTGASQFKRSTDQVKTSAAQASASVGGMGSAITRMSKMSGAQRFVFQNTANQLGDIAVQASMGTNIFRVLGQQIPQVAGGFAILGGSLGVVLPVLGVLAAVGFPLIAMFTQLGQGAKSFSEKLDALSSQLKIVKENTDLALSSNDDLSNSYGDAADAVRTFALAQAQLAENEARRQVLGLLADVEDLADVYVNLAFQTDRNSRMFNRLNRAVIDIKNDFQLGANDAKILQFAFNDLARALQDPDRNLNNVIETSESLFSLFKDLNIPLRTLSDDSLFEFSKALSEMGIEAAEARKIIDELNTATLGLIEVTKPAKDVDLFDPRENTLVELMRQGVDVSPFLEADSALEKISKTATKAASKTKEITEEAKRIRSAAEMVGNSFESAFMGVIRGTLSIKDAFRSMAVDIIAELYRIFVVKQITGFITSFLGGNFVSGPFMGVGSRANFAPPIRPFEGGGYTGNGPRTGGLDGRGGFMAMLHPNETVIDHTRGNSGGEVVVNQTINVSTGVQQTVRNEIQTLLPQIAEASKAAVLDARRRGGSFANAF